MATAKIKGKTLIIELPLNSDPQPTGSGKNLLVASTGAFVTTNAMFNGKPIRVAVNAIVKNAS